MKVTLIFILAILACSCHQQSYTDSECEQLARHTYKGLPKAASNFKKYCSKRSLKWSPERCTDVFKKIVIKTPQKELVQIYGDKFLECLSENDKNKFGAYLTE